MRHIHLEGNIVTWRSISANKATIPANQWQHGCSGYVEFSVVVSSDCNNARLATQKFFLNSPAIESEFVFITSIVQQKFCFINAIRFRIKQLIGIARPAIEGTADINIGESAAKFRHINPESNRCRTCWFATCFKRYGEFAFY